MVIAKNIVDTLSNITFEDKFEYVEICDNLYYFKHDNIHNSLEYSILFLLDVDFKFPYIDNNNIIRNFTKYTKSIQNVANLFNINILVFPDKIYTSGNKFNIMTKTIILYYKEIYYPVIDINNFNRFFNYDTDIIKKSTEKLETFSDFSEMSNLQILKNIYTKDIIVYKKTDLSNMKLDKLKEIALGLNINIFKENGKIMLKKNIIDLIYENNNS